MILVDSSVWIFAANRRRAEYWQLSNLIRKNEPLAYMKLIQIEVCQGAREQKQFEQLWDSFEGFDLIDIPDEVWEKAAWNYFRLRKNGLTVGTVDTLIATTAMAARAQIWSSDKHFHLMAPVLGFDLFDPPQKS